MIAACRTGNREVVEYLLRERNIVNWRGSTEGDTPLWVACENGHVHVARLLIENGADVNAANKYGHPPLHHACQNGNVAIVRLLLENKARVHLLFSEDHSGSNSWRDDYLAMFGTHGRQQREIIPPLREFRRVDEFTFVIRELNSDDGDDGRARTKYDGRDGPGFAKPTDRTLLHIAAKKGHLEIVRMLLKQVDVNGVGVDGFELAYEYYELADGEQPSPLVSPLWTACYEGHREIVELLISGMDSRVFEKHLDMLESSLEELLVFIENKGLGSLLRSMVALRIPDAEAERVERVGRGAAILDEEDDEEGVGVRWADQVALEAAKNKSRAENILAEDDEDDERLRQDVFSYGTD